MSFLDDVRAGVLAAMGSPEGRELLGGLIREAVAEVAPSGVRVAEYARISGQPVSTVRHLVRTGQLRHKRIGRSIIIDRSQLRPTPDHEIAAHVARLRGR